MGKLTTLGLVSASFVVLHVVSCVDSCASFDAASSLLDPSSALDEIITSDEAIVLVRVLVSDVPVAVLDEDGAVVLDKSVSLTESVGFEGLTVSVSLLAQGKSAFILSESVALGKSGCAEVVLVEVSGGNCLDDSDCPLIRTCVEVTGGVT